jgi:hypothetical protein
MYGPPLHCKRKRIWVWSAQMHTAFKWSQMTPGQEGMRCARDPFSYAVLRDFFLERVLRAPGSTVVPSPGSFANRTGSDNFPS